MQKFVFNYRLFYLFVMVLFATSCSVVKYVPEGETLLNRNRIKINKHDKIKVDELKPYLHQTQNNLNRKQY